MPRIVNLNQRIKKKKQVRKSPYVLDLRKEAVKKAEKKVLENKSETRKVLDSAGQKVVKKAVRVKKRLDSAREAMSAVKLRFNSAKFEPDVSRLSSKKQENKKTLKQKNIKTKKQFFESSLLLLKKIDFRQTTTPPTPPFDRLRAGSDRGETTVPPLTGGARGGSSASLITPFYIFRLRNSFVNVALFLLFIAVLILPIRGFTYVQELTEKRAKIIEHATVAASHLQEAKESGFEADLETVSYQFSEARAEFAAAAREVDEINKLTQAIIKIIPQLGGTFTAGEKVLILGESLSKVGQYFAEVVDILQNKIAGAENPTVKLDSINENFTLTIIQLEKANNIASSIKVNNLPTEYQDKIIKIQEYLPEVIEKTEKLLYYSKIIQNILGHQGMKRYLLVFQNNNEIRATGGFIGSYALMDFNQGRLENLEIPSGGSYDLEGGELKNIISPQALWLINPHWHFWDANWFLDFPTSATKLIEFYNSSGGPSVDGVIAINATLMQDLISVIGSVEVDGYDEVIDSENFIALLQEEGYKNKFAKEPKKLLSLAGPKILEQLISQPQNWLKILPILSKGLSQKDLQFYFTAYDLQKEVMDLGWSGRILETNKDYLAVAHTNLGGGKTDQVIQNTIWHSAEISDDGGVVDTLIITRAHQGLKGDPLTGVANNDYIRVYVPMGSKLISARGFSEMPPEAFESPEVGYQRDELIAEIESGAQVDRLSNTEIFTESNKTVFANWLHLEPGETKSVYLKYRLPFTVKKNNSQIKEYSIWEQVSIALNPKLESELLPFFSSLSYYSLLVQKQSGLNNTDFISQIKFPDDYQAVWNYPEWESGDGVLQTSRVLDRDGMGVVVFE